LISSRKEWNDVEYLLLTRDKMGQTLAIFTFVC